MKKTTAKRPLHRNTGLTEGFWKEQLEKIHNITVWDVLNKFEHDHEAGIMQNYQWVAEGAHGEHIGPPWYDGLICEVIRGISDILALSRDKKLEEKVDFYTGKIALAQAASPDGFIGTYTTLMCPDKCLGLNGGNLVWQHDTYNIGCLVEAGVHYYLATGKTKLLECAVKAADYLCGEIGPAPKKNIVPAHSLAEEAMVKLYRLLKNETALQDTLHAVPEKYLALAKFWMDHRGVHENRASFPHYMGEYAQDHCKITEQAEAVGHAVRAALFYTGLTAVGMETEEAAYLDAAKRIWDNVEQTKLHISGGIGAVHNEERFGNQYALPNDAYLETCAGVALAFWAGEMHLAFGDSRYMDVFERALYNNVLPGLSADGTRYFYENPLISDGSVERWIWHGCPCCPPMFLKLMGSLPDYAFSYKGDTVSVNLYMGGSARLMVGGKSVEIAQTGCKLPFGGDCGISLTLKKPQTFTVALRVPEWAGEFSATAAGKVFKSGESNGYIRITKEWADGEEIKISMELPAVKTEAHPYVSADTGMVALQRGPLLYCLEEIDNAGGTDVLLSEGALQVEEKDLLGEKIPCITGTCADGTPLTAVPYFLWNNRGRGTMRVWLRQQGKPGVERAAEKTELAANMTVRQAGKEELASWQGKLYRTYKP